MTNFTDTGNSAPSEQGSFNLADSILNPPLNTPGDEAKDTCNISYQTNFQGKTIYIIPQADWKNKRTLNLPFNVKGRQIAFGVLGDESDGTADLVDTVAVLHFNSVSSNNYANYRTTGQGVNSPGVNVALPPSEFFVFGNGRMLVTFEQDFDQFYLSIDGGSGQTNVGDFFVIVSSCAASVKATPLAF